MPRRMATRGKAAVAAVKRAFSADDVLMFNSMVISIIPSRAARPSGRPAAVRPAPCYPAAVRLAGRNKSTHGHNAGIGRNHRSYRGSRVSHTAGQTGIDSSNDQHTGQINRPATAGAKRPVSPKRARRENLVCKIAWCAGLGGRQSHSEGHVAAPSLPSAGIRLENRVLFNTENNSPVR